MDSTQPTFALTPPAFEPFGGPHFTGDDPAGEAGVVWVGDPSSVPFARTPERDEPSEPDATQLDRAIFAALVTP